MVHQKTKEVVATKKAYYDDHRVAAGDKLTVPVGFEADWAVDAKDYEPETEPTDAEKAEKAREGLQGKRRAKKA